MSHRTGLLHSRFRLLATTVAVATFATFGSLDAEAASCESLSSIAIPFTTVTTAQTVSGGTFTPPTGAPLTGLPSFCRVAMTIAPSADSAIQVEVWMPSSGWNGRFQGLGGGGYTGTIGYAALGDAIRSGYSGGITDMGTAPATTTNGLPLVGHPEKWLDFGSRSTHEMTVASKTVTAAFYERAPDRSYFVGCSTGGHQGFAEAQVYPDDYDGIVAGAPGHNRTHLHAWFVSNYSNSHRGPGSPISAAKLAVLGNAARTQCVGKDGGLATDTFLNDPRECNFDPAALQCTGGDGPDCLTASEVYTAKFMYDGLRNPRTGALIYPGWSVGTETGWAGLLNAPAFPGILNWALGANFDPLTIDFDTAMATVDATLAPTVNFMSSDLSRFTAHGGKMLLYHGFADAIVSPQDTINYYERLMSERNLSLEQTQSFARLFMVPGMGHCSGGEGPNVFDKLGPLVAWVENGIAPDQLVATKYVNNNPALGTQMTRPLCAYPKEARYTGSGDATNAANFVCVDDGNNERSQGLPAPEYLSPLVIQARAVPETLNLRSPGGLVTVVLSAPSPSNDFRQWIPSNIRAEGASPVSASLAADGRTYVVAFRRSDLTSFSGGEAPGNTVDLMLTGVLQHDGIQSLFSAGAAVKVLR